MRCLSSHCLAAKHTATNFGWTSNNSKWLTNAININWWIYVLNTDINILYISLSLSFSLSLSLYKRHFGWGFAVTNPPADLSGPVLPSVHGLCNAVRAWLARPATTESALLVAGHPNITCAWWPCVHHCRARTSISGISTSLVTFWQWSLWALWSSSSTLSWLGTRSLLVTITPTQRRRNRRRRASARFWWECYRLGLCRPHRLHLCRISKVVTSHHSKDVAFVRRIKDKMRCSIASVHRYELCPRRQSQIQQGGHLELCQLVPESKWNATRKFSKSPRQDRTQRNFAPRARRAKDKDLAPAFDPPWNSNQLPTTPSASAPSSSNAAEPQAAAQLQILVSKLKTSDQPLSPQEINQIIEESRCTKVTSKSMHQAGWKVDQARDKFKAAKAARQKLHNSRMKYVEESIKRWKTFAEDFTKKDAALDADLAKAREALQDAGGIWAEVISDGEIDDDAENMKADRAEVIQENIHMVVDSLEMIKVRPADENAEDMSAPKKARTELLFRLSLRRASRPQGGLPEAAAATMLPRYERASENCFVTPWGARIDAVDLSYEVGTWDQQASCSLHECQRRNFPRTVKILQDGRSLRGFWWWWPSLDLVATFAWSSSPSSTCSLPRPSSFRTTW